MENPRIIDRSNFQYQTILLAEDNDNDICIMRRAFDRAGITNPLQVVTDGEQAIAYLEGQVPYLDRTRYPLPVVLLLDLKMPKLNGLEVLEWARQRPELEHLTVHVLSASSRAVDVGRASQLGANAYIIKPSRFEDLVAMLKAWHTLAQFQAIAMPAATTAQT